MERKRIQHRKSVKSLSIKTEKLRDMTRWQKTEHRKYVRLKCRAQLKAQGSIKSL